MKRVTDILPKLFFAACCWLLLLNHAHAQNPIDSLERLLLKKHPDSLRLKLINNLNYQYIDVNADRSLQLSEQALSLVSKVSNKGDIAMAYRNAALAYEANGQYEESLVYSEKALKIFVSLRDTVRVASAYSNMGIAYSQLGDYSMAVYYMLKGNEINEFRKDTVGMSANFLNLSEVYFKSKSYTYALKLARKAHRLALLIHDESLQAYTSETLAIALTELNQFDSAFYFSRFARQRGLKYKNEYIVNRSYLHMANVFYKKGVYDSAEHYLTEGIKHSANKYYSDFLIPAKIKLALCLLANRDWVDAHARAAEAYRESIMIKNKNLALESASLLADIFHAQHHEAEAFEYLKLASLYKDTIMEQSIKGSIEAKAFDLNLEKEKREKQIAIFSLAEQEKVVSFQRFILSMAVIGFLGLITIVFLIRKSNIERRLANEQLTLKNAELAKLNQEVNALINTIVHDLKSPFNSLQGILSLMSLQLPNDSSSRELVDHGNKILAGGHEIIKQLLELRELEDNPIALHKTSFTIKEFLDEIKIEFLAQAQQKQLQLLVESETGSLTTDKLLLKRVLHNLISNAIKFSLPLKKITIRASSKNSVGEFDVMDEGPGFSEEDMEKIYGKFQKLSARPTAGESSHGLGLAIVNLLVKKLNGTIQLKSSLGEGAVFTIRVPDLTN